MADSHLVSITSLMEGSSNVLCEALTSDTPAVASCISGLIGTLGPNYPGYFPVGDTAALASLLARAESDPGFYEQLRLECEQAAALVSPEAELKAWRELLAEVCPS
jgi:glycosyltransferase involved in cell wall biosynthesis